MTTSYQHEILENITAQASERRQPCSMPLLAIAMNVKTDASRRELVDAVNALISDGMVSRVVPASGQPSLTVTPKGKAHLGAAEMLPEPKAEPTPDPQPAAETPAPKRAAEYGPDLSSGKAQAAMVHGANRDRMNVAAFAAESANQRLEVLRNMPMDSFVAAEIKRVTECAEAALRMWETIREEVQHGG